MPAGDLRERLTFAERAITSDGYGNNVGDYEDQFTVQASIVPRFGNEAFTAARLSGRSPATITVRYSSDTARITTDWKATDTRTGDVWDIKSPPVRMPDNRGYIEMMCEKGGSAG